MTKDTIDVENFNTPGRTAPVGREKYEAMRAAYLAALTDQPPGMSAAEAKAALLPLLDAELFPKGATSGWWMKTVQLDLEAKGIVARSKTKPLRFYKTQGSPTQR